MNRPQSSSTIFQINISNSIFFFGRRTLCSTCLLCLCTNRNERSGQSTTYNCYSLSRASAGLLWRHTLHPPEECSRCPRSVHLSAVSDLTRRGKQRWHPTL